jgi:hypothetical protein
MHWSIFFFDKWFNMIACFATGIEGGAVTSLETEAGEVRL